MLKNIAIERIPRSNVDKTAKYYHTDGYFILNTV